MAKRKLRQIRFQGKRKRQKKPVQTASRSAAPAPPATPPREPVLLNKQDVASKLIPLSVLSARDAQKSAEKTIDNVIAAMTHVLSEGDLTIADFGDFKASKTAKAGENRITFTPHDKLKQAVDARLSIQQVE